MSSAEFDRVVKAVWGSEERLKELEDLGVLDVEERVGRIEGQDGWLAPILDSYGKRITTLENEKKVTDVDSEKKEGEAGDTKVPDHVHRVVPGYDLKTGLPEEE